MQGPVSANFSCGNFTYANFPKWFCMLKLFGLANCKFQQVSVNGIRVEIWTPKDSELRKLVQTQDFRTETMRKPIVFLVSAQFQSWNEIFHPVIIWVLHSDINPGDLAHKISKEMMQVRSVICEKKEKRILLNDNGIVTDQNGDWMTMEMYLPFNLLNGDWKVTEWHRFVLRIGGFSFCDCYNWSSDQSTRLLLFIYVNILLLMTGTTFQPFAKK